MRALVLGMMFIANSALAIQSGYWIEPSNATTKVIEIAEKEARNTLMSKDNRIRIADVYVGLGKYSFGKFGDYFVNMTAVAFAREAILNCKGMIRIVRGPVIKHDQGEWVLETSSSDGHLETYVNVRDFNCTEEYE